MEIEKIQELVEAIMPEVQKLGLQMNNLDTAAQMNGFKVDWESGKVTKK